MSKPIQEITIESIDKKTSRINALFDTGSFYSIVRKDLLPRTKFVFWYPEPQKFKTAAKKGKIQIIGATRLVIEIDNRKIVDDILISSQLNREMIVGAGTMQKWDISVINGQGITKIFVGRDMRDPEITEVD